MDGCLEFHSKLYKLTLEASASREQWVHLLMLFLVCSSYLLRKKIPELCNFLAENYVFFRCLGWQVWKCTGMLETFSGWTFENSRNSGFPPAKREDTNLLEFALQDVSEVVQWKKNKANAKSQEEAMKAKFGRGITLTQIFQWRWNRTSLWHRATFNKSFSFIMTSAKNFCSKNLR